MAGLGRKVWGSETLSAPDLQGYLQDQVAARFANAAARSAAIPAPTEGMLSTLDDTDAVYRHDGTVWRKIAGPPQLLVSVASASVTASMSNTGAFQQGATLAVPAHDPGVLLLEYRGMWTATGNAAATWYLNYPSGGAMVNGSYSRGGNNGVANIPVAIQAAGRVSSDGTARTVEAGGTVDAGGAAITPRQASWHVWLV